MVRSMKKWSFPEDFLPEQGYLLTWFDFFSVSEPAEGGRGDTNDLYKKNDINPFFSSWCVYSSKILDMNKAFNTIITSYILIF